MAVSLSEKSKVEVRREDHIAAVLHFKSANSLDLDEIAEAVEQSGRAKCVERDDELVCIVIPGVVPAARGPLEQAVAQALGKTLRPPGEFTFPERFPVRQFPGDLDELVDKKWR